MNNNKTIRELLSYLKCCFDIASKKLLKHYPKKVEDNIYSTINVATYCEVEEDVILLMERLIHAYEIKVFEYYRLINHLLQMLEDLNYRDIKDLDVFNLTSNMKSLDIIKREHKST